MTAVRIPSTRTLTLFCTLGHPMTFRLSFDGERTRAMCPTCSAVIESHLFVKDGQWVPSWKWVELPFGGEGYE